MALCLVTLTDLETRRTGLSASAELLVCIVLLQIRVVRFSGQLSCSLSSLFMTYYVTATMSIRSCMMSEVSIEAV